jgi:antitoxin component of MazEF toxin-antitoxin module
LIRVLQRHGNSFALVFDMTMLEAMNLTPQSPLNITIAGGSMVITAANVDIPETKLQEAIAELRPRYKTMLENLAE